MASDQDRFGWQSRLPGGPAGLLSLTRNGLAECRHDVRAREVLA
jgi:hypothetical protein